MEFISAQTIIFINEKAEVGGYVETYYQTDKSNCKAEDNEIEDVKLNLKVACDVSSSWVDFHQK